MENARQTHAKTKPVALAKSAAPAMENASSPVQVSPVMQMNAVSMVPVSPTHAPKMATHAKATKSAIPAPAPRHASKIHAIALLVAMAGHVMHKAAVSTIPANP
jgi:hypothetical protein